MVVWDDLRGVYIGQISIFSYHGFGIYRCKDGDICSGFHKNGIKFGCGIIKVQSNQSLIKGCWIDDELEGEAVFTDKNGKIELRKYENGEIVE